MRTSLVLKLMSAFALVILISALVIYFLTSRATQKAFRLYSTQSGQIWAERLAPTYAEYYQAAGNWAGVESLIEAELADPGMHGMMGGSRGRGMGMNGWMGGMGQRLILADAQGRVLVDSETELQSAQLTADELAVGSPILADGQQVGTLIITPSEVLSGSNPASLFLTNVNRSIWISILVAGLISLALVLLLSLQITSPVRQMQKAAGAIADGKLDQRVQVRTKDELGDLAQSFNHMASSLASAEMQRRKLIADIAHELRTPTAVIQARTEGMQDGVLPLDISQVDSIHSEALLLGRLIDDLRLISLAEAGELQLERADTDLADLLRRAAGRNQAQCAQKGVDLQLDLAGPLPKVNVDSDRIHQVLNNLIANALRYTPPGGRIVLRAEPAAQGAAVSVIDSGDGIAAEDLPWVFDRFFRGDKSRTRASGGSGLGLSIVKQLIEAHGGSVTAASPVFEDDLRGGFGTSIRLFLPAA